MTQLFHMEKCFSCINFENGDKQTIEDIILFQGDTLKIKAEDNKFLFVIKGSLNISFGEYSNLHMDKKRLLLLPANHSYQITALSNVVAILFRLRIRTRICDAFSLERLKEECNSEYVEGPFFLNIDPRLNGYLNGLRVQISNKFKCTFYFDLKVKELFFLIGEYYCKKDLYRFFYPLITSDLIFSEAVYRNHQYVRTVTELAEKTNYSLSGFQKKFKKVFGISAHNWMSEQRSRVILSEINNTDKTFKEISDEYGFSSPSHFNDFCKSHFGLTPGMLREGIAKNKDNK